MRRALAVLALVACSGKRKAPPPPPPPIDAAPAPTVVDLGPPDHQLDLPPPPMPQHVRDTLLEPGAAPRTALRYRIAGAVERSTTVRAVITQHGFRDDAWYGPTTLPAITDGFAVAAAPPSGLAVRALPIVVEGGSPAADEVAVRWRLLLERRRATVVVDDRGQLGAITFADDPDRKRPDAELAADELAARWLGLAVPLPVEPVGVGARWRVVTTLRLGGAYQKQTATYRLAARDGERLTIEVDVARLAERQRLSFAGLARGVEVELIGLVRQQTGSLTVDLTAPLPIAGTLATTQSSHAQVRLPGAQPVDEVTDDRAELTIATP